ncbi:MAG: UvrD-helicase domain-containing protein [Terrimicrobiaceae bacterium]|nr:UvrD-helicase domain-containing protein [Terrimicrobiaceae bacterium]
MIAVESEAILASAGTGKTHALTSRILRLLALGVKPEALIALTFTRKAAGEFAATVFRRLATAARDPDAARELSADLCLEGWDASRFQALLAVVVGAIEQLQFRTFDAFFQRVVNAMPFELGLPGGVQMLDDAEAAAMRDRVLSGLLAADFDSGSQTALLAAYRDATWGAEEKGLRRKLEGFIKTSHSLYLECREASQWGGADGIWPAGCGWLNPAEARDDALALGRWAQSKDGEIYRAVESLAVAAQKWEPAMRLPTGRVFEQLLEQLAADPSATALTLTYRNKEFEIDASIVPAIHRVIGRLIGESLRRHLRITTGIRRVLEPFDAAYHEEVRLTGRLAFADVVEMLRLIPALEWQARLDARVDHWLFDEFQDTSLQQWAVVENLVDEVLQDDSGRRSAFFVGDPKQSIYRWRGGEHRLMEQILAHYRGRIRERVLAKSYRSDPAVLELVNRYGAVAADPSNGLPAEVVTEWARFWQPHESAAKDRQGHATVRLLESADELPDRVLADLERIDPIGRGLTCAVLTRDNAAARTLAAALRERGYLRVAAETDESIATDAPVNRGLLALLAAVAHPADTASIALVEMSPLGALPAAEGWPAFRTWFLARLTARGLEAALRAVITRLPEGGPPDDFSRQRLRLLFEFARKHDAAGRGGLDDFLRLATTHGRREVASSANVQILTIHRAKGLGFDVVLLPVFDTTRMDGAPRDTFLAWRSESLETRWLLHRPAAAVSDMDPVLAAAQRQQIHAAAYDALCVWYVGLTRAKHALHVFTLAPGKSGGASPVALLRRALSAAEPGADGLLWEAGDVGWFRAVSAPTRDLPCP